MLDLIRALAEEMRGVLAGGDKLWRRRSSVNDGEAAPGIIRRSGSAHGRRGDKVKSLVAETGSERP